MNDGDKIRLHHLNSEIDNNTDLYGIINDIKWTVFLGMSDSKASDHFTSDDLIGFSNRKVFKKGMIFSNPWQDKSFLEVVDVNQELERVVVQIRSKAHNVSS